MIWILIILFVSPVAAMAPTLAAVALRPCQRTVRAATVALLALPAAVILILLIAGIASL